MKFQKQILSIFITLFLLNLVHAKDEVENEEPEEIILIPGPITGNYTDNDLIEDYDNSSIKIQCDGTKCKSSCTKKVLFKKGKEISSSNNVSCNNNISLKKGNVTISEAGTYIFEGNLNGQLNINAGEDDLVHLILRDATISSDFGPAIYSEICKKIIITTEGKSTISDSINYPEDAISYEAEKEAKEDEETEGDKKNKSPNSCIFVNNNLTFNGKGVLNIKGNFNEAINCKENLKFISGKINVISKGKGIKAKESVSVKEAIVSVDAGNSGIKATKKNKPNKGFIVIDGGKVIVKAKNDGIHAETHLTINGGFIDVLESGEGLEGQMIDITGGDIYIKATNDGINAGKIGPAKEDIPAVIMDENGNIIKAFPPVPKKSKRSTEVIDDEDSEYENEVKLDDDEDSEYENEVKLDDDEDSEYENEVKLNNDEDTEFENEIKNIDNDLKENPTETLIENPSEVSTEIVEPSINSPSSSENGNEQLPSAKDSKDDDQIYIRITGGRVHVRIEGDDNDGIDSNGSLYIGGNSEVYVDDDAASLFGVQATLDANDYGVIKGNTTLFITGAHKTPTLPLFLQEPVIVPEIDEIHRMYPDFTEKQVNQYIKLLEEMATKSELPPPPADPENLVFKQPYLKATFDKVKKVDTSIIVKDKEGNVLINHKPREKFVIMLYSSPKINEGETYTIISGNETITAVAQVDKDKEIPNEKIEIIENY